jgi:hypothetical protein
MKNKFGFSKNNTLTSSVDSHPKFISAKADMKSHPSSSAHNREIKKSVFGLFLMVFGLLLVSSLGMVSLKKTWSFENYTVNISNGLHVNGTIYGDGSGLTGVGGGRWNVSGVKNE